MFVDASGDDGYTFRESSNTGSSYSFVVSCFTTTLDDFEHNKSVLLAMKKAMLVKPEQEIKSTALRRNRNANRVYSEFQNLKGTCFSLVADKRLIQECRPLSDSDFSHLTKIAYEDLSGITHVFPFISLNNSGLLSEGDKVLIVIDNMKKREMDSIRDILEAEYSAEKYDLIFRDSKDKNFPLIQIADIIAGTIRNYYEDCLPIKAHNRYCKLCIHTPATSYKDKSLKYMCKSKRGKKLFSPYISNKNFNSVIMHHKIPGETINLGNNFIILPIDQLLYFYYIACLILDE